MAAARPYVDRPVVDLDAATAVAGRVATEWSLPRPTPIRSGMNALYAAGDVVLRVGHASGPASAAHALVRVMRTHGVPTIRPVDGLTDDVAGFAVSAWERVGEAGTAVDWEAVGAAVRLVHAIPISEIPTDYPIPEPTSFPWWDFESMLADVGCDIDPGALAGLSGAIERHADWRRVTVGAVVCHGDVHPGNVLVATEGPVLIDWDLLCSAAPAWDHAMLTTWRERWGGEPGVYEAFLAGYGEPSVDEDLARSLGELRNVAATLMRVRVARTDPAAAVEAARRLAYWRGESTAPWHAQ